MIISKDSSKTSLENAIYICVIGQNEFSPDYIQIFSHLSGIGFEKMILVLYEEEKFETKQVMNYTSHSINLPVPEITLDHFSIANKKFTSMTKDITDILNFFEAHSIKTTNAKNISSTPDDWLLENLEKFSESELLKIYMNRLFLDGFIGFSKKKGKPSDIDMIVKNSAGKFSLIEIKEKDLPKKNKKGFGFDTPRLKDFLRIVGQTGLDYYLIVREVNNQIDRELVGYKYISVEDFAKDVKDSKTVIGGTGMRRSMTVNETVICSYDLFSEL